MTRGRPPKFAKVEEDEKNVVSRLSHLLHAFCWVPGCSDKLHADEAEEVLGILKSEGYIVRETVKEG